MEQEQLVYKVEVSFRRWRGSDADYYVVRASSSEEAIQKVKTELDLIGDEPMNMTGVSFRAEIIDIARPYYTHTR